VELKKANNDLFCDFYSIGISNSLLYVKNIERKIKVDCILCQICGDLFHCGNTSILFTKAISK